MYNLAKFLGKETVGLFSETLC